MTSKTPVIEHVIEEPFPDADCQWCGDTGLFLDTDGNEWPCVNGCPPVISSDESSITYDITNLLKLLKTEEDA